MQRPVAGEPRGPGVRARSSRRPRPATRATISVIDRRAAEARELALDLRRRAARSRDLARAVFALGDLEQLGRLAGERVAARRRDERLAGPARTRSARIRRRSVELREDVVEQEQRARAGPLRPAARPRRAAARARPGAARPASRSVRRSRLGREDADVVEVRAERRSCHARDRGRGAPRAPRRSARRPRSAARAASRPSSPARSAKAGCERARRSRAGRPRARRRARRPARSRARAPPATRRRARPAAAPRSAAPTAAPYSAESAGAAGAQPSERAVEVRPARGGPALDHDEPVGREDERRHLGPQLLGRAQRRAVQRCPLAAAELAASPRARAGTPAREPRSAIACRVPAEAHQLGVRTRPRREALRPDMQRLEQVRLAGAVRAGHQHEAGLELQVERRVRAVVAER